MILANSANRPPCSRILTIVKSGVDCFVAMLACQSILMDKRYYSILKKMNGKNGFPKLKIGIIYSDAPNTGIDEAGFIDDEDIDASCLASSDRGRPR